MRVAFILGFLGMWCSVSAATDDSIKKGTHPFMAFIYYLDTSIVDVTGARFIRAACLIRADWLVTSALGPSIINTSNGFPQKTMLARAGALTIDANFTLNEDEDEQEREVIKVVQPFNLSSTRWWTTDISLLQTLLPFNMTPAVGVKSLNFNQDYKMNNCFILVYSRNDSNSTLDKSLMQLSVEMLAPSIAECGSHWAADTMTCATTAHQNNDTAYDEDFCVGNSGGPLICETEITALQTYIENNCQPPHLYQLVAPWENFIDCCVVDKYYSENCSNVCDITFKDAPVTEAVTEVVNVTSPSTEIGNVTISEETATEQERSSETTETCTEAMDDSTNSTVDRKTYDSLQWPKEKQDKYNKGTMEEAGVEEERAPPVKLAQAERKPAAPAQPRRPTPRAASGVARWDMNLPYNLIITCLTLVCLN